MNISKIIYTIFVIFTVLVAVLIIFPLLPINGNYKIMAVLSGSMEPAIKTGGIVIVKPFSEYKVGDVISFATAAGLKVSTTHRIVEIKTAGGKTTYITKGDANSDKDAGEVDKRNVIGKVLFSMPYAGYLLAFVRQPMGFVAAVIIPSMLVVFDEGQNVWREMRMQKRNNMARRVGIPCPPPPFKGYRIKIRKLS